VLRPLRIPKGSLRQSLAVVRFVAIEDADDPCHRCVLAFQLRNPVGQTPLAAGAWPRLNPASGEEACWQSQWLFWHVFWLSWSRLGRTVCFEHLWVIALEPAHE
jgi:hypothetical protein